MKFSNGFWLDKEGVDVSRPMEARQYEFDGQVLRVYTPHKHMEGRGNSVDLIMSVFEFSGPIDNVIRTHHYHHIGNLKKGANYKLNAEKTHLVFEANEQKLILKNGQAKVEINKVPFEVNYYFNNELKTKLPTKASAYITDENKQHYMREMLTVGIGETVYGLGERFTPFVKNGQLVEMWQADGGTCSEQSYKNIPFYLTSNNYGIFVDHSDDVSFEVCSEVVNRVSMVNKGEELRFEFMGGNNLKEVLERYTFRTGRPPLLPSWSFGLWLSTSFTTDYDENTINHFIDGMAKYEIPLSVFHFDCFWMKESEWCNFEFDDEMFSNPTQILADLKKKGLHICVWINPYIAQKSPLFKEAMENGYFIKNEDGSVWQTDKWQFGMGIIDFTNQDACNWYCSKLKRLLDMGVDCFKTDFGERIPTHVKYEDGSDPVKMHNYYTYLYNKTVFDLLTNYKGKNEAVLFSRSATATCQQFPVHWGGDCSSNYDSMAETLRGGLSLCMSGFAYWSHDISGFELSGTPDLYKRWVAFGLLSSHSRLHGNQSYRVPWLFDQQSCDVLKFFTELKGKLMPYLLYTSLQAHVYGTPMMRSMVLEFNEPATRYLDLQYMLGDNLLVAPIFNDQGKVTYYLPKGKWTHLLSNEVKQGSNWYEDTYDYFSLGLFVRENSMILMTTDQTNFDGNYQNFELHVYYPKDTLTTYYNNHTITFTSDRRLVTDLQNVKVIIHE